MVVVLVVGTAAMTTPSPPPNRYLITVSYYSILLQCLITIPLQPPTGRLGWSPLVRRHALRLATALRGERGAGEIAVAALQRISWSVAITLTETTIATMVSLSSLLLLNYAI